jgi:hypothetical protein
MQRYYCDAIQRYYSELRCYAALLQLAAMALL